MLFGNRAAGEYPNLMAYLRESERTDLWQDLRSSELFAWILAALWPILLIPFPGISRFVPGLLVPGLAYPFGFFIAYRFVSARRQAYSTPEFESRVDAHKVLASMRKMNQMHRLHRDLSESTLTVLEEIARTRNEIKNILEMPYWKQPDLGSTYKQLRDQAAVACDQAMLDAVLQFKAAMPDKVEARKVGDFVDEALESVVKVGRKSAKFAEAGFDAAFRIAGKLQDMRNALEKMTEDASNDVLRGPSQVPGGLVDMTLSEIKTIQQAEQELRQGL